MKKFINKLYNHQGGQLLISVFMAALCFAVLYLTHDIYWAIGDDTDTMKIVSGYMSGSPTFCAPFINAFLGYIFTFLYSLTTAIPWYTLFHILIIFVSITVLFRLNLLIFNRKNISILVPVISSILLFFAVFTHMTVYMLFTSNAIIIGCAAIALLFIADFNSKKKICYLYYALSGICIILSFMLRRQCGQLTSCFWGLSLVYIVIKSFIKDKKSFIPKTAKLIIFVLVILLVSSLIQTSSQEIKVNYETENFSQYNNYRAKFLDYTVISWDSNEEFYKSIGWDESFYRLAKSWFFMDSRFNLDNLKAINEQTIAGGYSDYSLKESLFMAFNTAVIKYPVGLALTLAIVALCMLNLFLFLFSRNKKDLILTFIYAICAFGGFTIMSLYLCVGGRFLFHIYQTVAIPIIVVLYITSALVWQKGLFKRKNRRAKTFVTIISIILVCIISSSTVLSIYDAYIYRDYQYQYNKELMESMDEYVVKNPENLYIHSCGDDFRAFIDYNTGYASNPNLIRWGGCTMFTRSYYNLIKLHGYDNLYSEHFYDDGVYLIVENLDNNEKLQLIDKYLDVNYGETEMVAIYQNEYFTVFDINKR